MSAENLFTTSRIENVNQIIAELYDDSILLEKRMESFVGDLVGGTYSNGSDERDYADQWFERCWFGM